MPALAAALALAALLSQGVPATKIPQAPADAAAIKEFNDHVADYMKLAKAAASGLPVTKSSDSTTVVADAQHDLAARIRAARAGVGPAAVFTPQVAALFRRRLAEVFAGPEAARIHASLARAEPDNSFPLAVNAVFPAAVPLQSTPPTLLLNLPTLPPELEYRFVGRSLVLHDRISNLVVDWIASALPANAAS